MAAEARLPHPRARSRNQTLSVVITIISLLLFLLFTTIIIIIISWLLIVNHCYLLQICDSCRCSSPSSSRSLKKPNIIVSSQSIKTYSTHLTNDVQNILVFTFLNII